MIAYASVRIRALYCWSPRCREEPCSPDTLNMTFVNAPPFDMLWTWSEIEDTINGVIQEVTVSGGVPKDQTHLLILLRLSNRFYDELKMVRDWVKRRYDADLELSMVGDTVMAVDYLSVRVSIPASYFSLKTEADSYLVVH